VLAEGSLLWQPVLASALFMSTQYCSARLPCSSTATPVPELIVPSAAVLLQTYAAAPKKAAAS